MPETTPPTLPQSTSAGESVRLMIGGAPLEITANSSNLIQRMAGYYAAFAAGEIVSNPATLVRLAVDWRGLSAVSSPFLPVVTFGDVDVQYNAEGCQGRFNFLTGEARLTLDTAHPFEPLEYFIRLIIGVRAYEAGGFLFHGAGIAHKGRGIIFFGPSGTGKTTVSRLSVNDTVLNDDLVLLMPAGDGWMIHSTPFWNPTQVKPQPTEIPLNGLFRLVQAKEVFARQPSQASALAEMAANIPVLCTDPRRGPAILQRILSIMALVPVYKLHFLPDDSFWPVVDEVLQIA